MPAAAPWVGAACRGSRDGRPRRPQSKSGHRSSRSGKPADQCVDHCPCLPVFFSWLHFRQPRRQEPHVAAHSSDHRIGSGLRPRDCRPFVGAGHPLRPHFARSSSADHRWSEARDTRWPTWITSSGRHIMRRSVRQVPSAASTRPPCRTNASLCQGGCSGWLWTPHRFPLRVRFPRCLIVAVARCSSRSYVLASLRALHLDLRLVAWRDWQQPGKEAGLGAAGRCRGS